MKQSHEIYQNIRLFREERGWSQTDLAKKIGYKDKAAISRIEAGLVDLPLSKVSALAAAFGVDVATLWGDTIETVVIHATKHEEAVLNAYRAKSPQEQGIIDAALGVKKMQSSLASLDRKEA